MECHTQGIGNQNFQKNVFLSTQRLGRALIRSVGLGLRMRDRVTRICAPTSTPLTLLSRGLSP